MRQPRTSLARGGRHRPTRCPGAGTGGPSALGVEPPALRPAGGSGRAAGRCGRCQRLAEQLREPLTGGLAVAALRAVLGRHDAHATSDKVGRQPGGRAVPLGFGEGSRGRRVPPQLDPAVGGVDPLAARPARAAEPLLELARGDNQPMAQTGARRHDEVELGWWRGHLDSLAGPGGVNSRLLLADLPADAWWCFASPQCPAITRGAPDHWSGAPRASRDDHFSLTRAVMVEPSWSVTVTR